jgi:hypothetical protein
LIVGENIRRAAAKNSTYQNDAKRRGCYGDVVSTQSKQHETSLPMVLRTVLLFVLGTLASPAHAKSLRVTGTTGYLSEWQMSGDVTETISGRIRQFAGPLTMKHVGLCSQNGPEEKAAEIKFEITDSRPLPRIRAILVMDGIHCTFSGTLSDTYDGAMDCANAKGVPIGISLK